MSHGATSAARAGGGQLSTLVPSSIPNIDQVDCFARTDFFEVWYGSGLNEICFANAGTVNLDIRGVWFIRTGNNGGRMKFGQNLVFIDQIFGKFQNLDFSNNPIELFQVKIT